MSRRTVAYIRCSLEDADPQRQRDTIERHAHTSRLVVDHWYQDMGGRRHQSNDPKRRPEWTKLRAEAASGNIDILLCEEVSRLGTTDEWALMALCHELRQQGVTLIEAKSGRVVNGDSVADFLTTGVAGHTSRSEVQQLASRTLGNRIARVRDHGSYQGGPVPHGLMLSCRDATGRETWTLEVADDGRKIQTWESGQELWHPPDYVPSRREGELLYEVPSRRYPERAEHVRLAFGWYLAERVSCGEIARRLNTAGARPTGGRVWYSSRIQSLLQLPIYSGYMTIGRRRAGRYSTHKDGAPGAVTREDRNGKQPREAWTWSREPVYAPGIVSREDWEAAQAEAERRKRGPRVGKNPDLILSGLVVCTGCDKIMSGANVRQKGRADRLVYCCSTYITHHGHPPTPCRSYQVRQDYLLELVGRWLAETGAVLSEVSEGDEEGLLRSLYADRDAAREGLREAREAVEEWLSETLSQVAEPEISSDGRKTYRVGDWVVTLPGANYSDLVEVYGWAKSATGARERARLAELEAEHGRLYDLLKATPTKMMADRCLNDIRRCEEELSRHRSGVSGLSGRLRELHAEMVATGLQINRARRALAGSDHRRRAKAIHEMVERIEVSHRLEPRSASSPEVLVARLDSVKIIPRVASSERSTPARASSSQPGCR